MQYHIWGVFKHHLHLVIISSTTSSGLASLDDEKSGKKVTLLAQLNYVVTHSDFSFIHPVGKGEDLLP